MRHILLILFAWASASVSADTETLSYGRADGIFLAKGRAGTPELRLEIEGGKIERVRFFVYLEGAEFARELTFSDKTLERLTLLLQDSFDSAGEALFPAAYAYDAGRRRPQVALAMGISVHIDASWTVKGIDIFTGRTPHSDLWMVPLGLFVTRGEFEEARFAGLAWGCGMILGGAGMVAAALSYLLTR